MPNVNIRILPGARKMTLAGMKSYLLQHLGELYPGEKLVSQSDSVLGGVRDIDIVLLDTQHGPPNRLHQICALHNKSLYMISIGYPQSQYARDEPVIAQMLASFHWK